MSQFKISKAFKKDYTELSNFVFIDGDVVIYIHAGHMVAVPIEELFITQDWVETEKTYAFSLEQWKMLEKGEMVLRTAEDGCPIIQTLKKGEVLLEYKGVEKTPRPWREVLATAAPIENDEGAVANLCFRGDVLMYCLAVLNFYEFNFEQRKQFMLLTDKHGSKAFALFYAEK